MNIEDGHAQILDTAAGIANRAYRESLDAIRYRPGERFNLQARGERGGLMGDIFRADPGRSDLGGLCLSMDESITKGRSKEEVEELHRIGREAIIESITAYHPNLFVGLILEAARNGEDYFERFETTQQLRLL